MIDQLAIVADEVKKVSREVRTKRKLDVRAEVGNVQGIWQEIMYVSPHSFTLERVSMTSMLQIVHEYHGRKFDNASEGLRTDLGSNDGW
jgi:hypothetical protein